MRVELRAHQRAVILNVDPRDHIGRVICKSGRFYESDLLEDAYQRLLATDRPGLVVDAGAHVGNHSLWFAEVCNRPVVAVEPVPEHVLQLNSHVRLNQPRQPVNIYNVALGAREERARIEPGPAGNSGMAQVVADPAGAVACVTLDDLIVAESGGVPTDCLPVALIKIDVEGSAVAVLEGAAEVLERDRPLLYVEGDFNEIHAHLGSAWRGFGQFGRTPTWGFQHAG